MPHKFAVTLALGALASSNFTQALAREQAEIYVQDAIASVSIYEITTSSVLPTSGFGPAGQHIRMRVTGVLEANFWGREEPTLVLVAQARPQRRRIPLGLIPVRDQPDPRDSKSTC